MIKDIEYYMKLKYPIEIKELASDEGGGYVAIISQLGRDTFVGDGDTVQEAIDDLIDTKKMWFETYLKEGKIIPEPVDEDKVEFSGRFVVRVPKKLHALLASNAKKEGISLNQYVVTLLSMNNSGIEVGKGYANEIQSTVHLLNEVLQQQRAPDTKAGFLGYYVWDLQKHKPNFDLGNLQYYVHGNFQSEEEEDELPIFPILNIGEELKPYQLLLSVHGRTVVKKN